MDTTILELSDFNAINAVLQEDLQSIRSQRKDRRRADAEPDDEELALRALEEEVQSMSIYLQDLHLARSLATALETDGELLQRFVSIDAQVEADYQFASRLRDEGDVSHSPASPHTNSRGTSSTDNTSDMVNEGTTYERPPPDSRCIVCDENASGTQGLLFPCDHAYDIPCAVELFRQATRDESLMPPRCCRREIPVNQVLPYLQQRERDAFLEKLREYTTPNCLYCPRPICSKFMGSAEGNTKILTCPDCYIRVCTGCKKEAHAAYIPCDTDTEAQQLLELGESQGWQRCPGCHRMVELSMGCFHMTCLCRTQFCYLCRALWKNCNCPQWEENRLLVTAQQRVAQQNAHHPEPAPAERARQVQAAVEILRENHECEHPRWDVRQGRSQCENCYYWLDRYILCCRRCQMRACVRCVRNRL